MGLIAANHDPDALHKAYRDDQPLPHVVIDGFLDKAASEALAEELEAPFHWASWQFADQETPAR